MPTADAIEIYAHRGASSLLTEGTIPAYEAAILIGANTLDMDIALTKDNVIVVNHDQRLSDELTRDARGKWLRSPGPYIRELTLAELKTYDVGALNPHGKLIKLKLKQLPKMIHPMQNLKRLFQYYYRYYVKKKY
jgi:glycerophosphoryl diester phosphodiesterase